MIVPTLCARRYTQIDLKECGIPKVGADLSAKGPVHPTHMRWLKNCIRGQVRLYGRT